MSRKMFFKEEKSNNGYYYIILLLILSIVFIFYTDSRVAIKKYTKEYSAKIEEVLNMKKEKVDLGYMPTWDLSDLYKSLDDEQINIDLNKLEKDIKNFQRYKGKIDTLNGKELYDALIEYENISELMSKLGSYASLKYTENLS